MSHIQGVERTQSVMFPAVLDEYVSEGNPVRFIDAYVDSLKFEQLGFTHAETKPTGRPPYSPADMLKLYVYGYLNKVRSSRQLEQLTHRNIEVMWLLCKLHPDFKTIADFRKDNTNALKSVCRDFTLLCKKLNLFGGELVGIDDKIDTYFTRLDNEDTTEETRQTSGPQSSREHIANLRLHKGELEELQKTLEASGETQILQRDTDCPVRAREYRLLYS